MAGLNDFKLVNIYSTESMLEDIVIKEIKLYT